MSIRPKSIALQFPNMQMLWKFAQQLKCTSIKINTANTTLISDCTDGDIQLALTEYKAQILEGEVASLFTGA